MLKMIRFKKRKILSSVSIHWDLEGVPGQLLLALFSHSVVMTYCEQWTSIPMQVWKTHGVMLSPDRDFRTVQPLKLCRPIKFHIKLSSLRSSLWSVHGQTNPGAAWQPLCTVSKSQWNSALMSNGVKTWIELCLKTKRYLCIIYVKVVLKILSIYTNCLI